MPGLAGKMGMHTAGIGGTREHFAFIVNPSKAHRMKVVSVRFLKKSHIVLLAAAAAVLAGPSNGGASIIFRPPVQNKEINIRIS